jgi:hypothetical protein
MPVRCMSKGIFYLAVKLTTRGCLVYSSELITSTNLIVNSGNDTKLLLLPDHRLRKKYIGVMYFSLKLNWRLASETCQTPTIAWYAMRSSQVL